MTPEAPVPARSARRATEIRLIVALPVLMTLLTVAVGLWTVYLTAGGLPGVGAARFGLRRDVAALRETIFIVVGVGGGSALLLGLVLAYSIRRPIKALLDRAENLLPFAIGRPARRVNELTDLSNTLNHLLLSFEKYAMRSGIVEHLPQGLLTVSLAGEILDANPEACRILTMTPAQLAGKNIAQFLQPDEAQLLPALRSAERVEVARLTLIAGDNGRAEVQAQLLPVEGRPEVILALTDLIQARSVQMEIRRVDRLAALGALGASVVHEIGGALQAVQTLMDLVAPRVPAGSREHGYVAKIDAELERIRRLADEIRTLAQVESRQQVPCQLEAITAEALWMAERRFERGKEVTVVRNLPSGLPPLRGDPDRLHRALLNLLVNAFEATPDGGRITVSIAEAESIPLPGSPRGLVARVANSGSYLSPAERERVFDLFYTTKKQGSGLGLPVVYRAVADHGGTVTVESSLEAGTEFAIFLPLDEAARPQ